jgi:hypothetical protein
MGACINIYLSRVIVSLPAVEYSVTRTENQELLPILTLKTQR